MVVAYFRLIFRNLSINTLVRAVTFLAEISKALYTYFFLQTVNIYIYSHQILPIQDKGACHIISIPHYTTIP
jgi:hypothetical protein